MARHPLGTVGAVMSTWGPSKKKSARASAGRSRQRTRSGSTSPGRSAEPTVTSRRPGIPPLLAHVVMKCLEKRPADRPQTASDLIATIDMLTTPSGGTVPLRAVPSGAVETVIKGGPTGGRPAAQAHGPGSPGAWRAHLSTGHRRLGPLLPE